MCLSNGLGLFLLLFPVSQLRLFVMLVAAGSITSFAVSLFLSFLYIYCLCLVLLPVSLFFLVALECWLALLTNFAQRSPP
jgi:hypothetical protein